MTDQEAFDQGVQEGMERIMQGKPAVEEKRWPDVFYATHEFEEIVRRYDMHDELLEALEAVAKELDGYLEFTGPHYPSYNPMKKLHDIAAAAIAKARKS